MNNVVSLPALRSRFDRQAIEQLRAEVVRLAAENERLAKDNERLMGLWEQAERWADSWREDALDMQLQLCERTNSAPGLTISGHLTAVNSAGDIVRPLSTSPINAAGDGDAYLCLAQ